MAVLALAASAFVLNLNTNVFGPLLPFLGPDLGIDGDGAKLMIAMAGFGSAFGALLVARLSRRFGRRNVLLLSLAVFAAVSCAHVFVHEFWPFAILRALSGLSVGLAYAAASTSAAEMTSYERRGAAMGTFNAGMFLAFPVGLPLAVWMASNGWWPWVFAVQAGVAAVAFLVTLRSVPDSVEPVHVASGEVLRRPGVIAGLLATMLHVGAFFVTVQLAGGWLHQSGYVPRDQQMWLWVGLGVMSVVGSAGLARFSDKLGKRAFVLLTSAILVICFLALSREPAPMLFLCISIVLATAAAARTGPLQALLTGLVDKQQFSALMGLRGFCMQFGVGGFALLATLLPQDQNFGGVLLLSAGCLFLSYVAIRVGVREPRG